VECPSGVGDAGITSGEEEASPARPGRFSRTIVRSGTLDVRDVSALPMLLRSITYVRTYVQAASAYSTPASPASLDR